MSDDRQLLLPSAADAGSSTPDRTISPYRVPEDPVERTKCQTRVAFFTVILTEALERMAFYCLVSNMVLFLNSDPFGWASYNAAMALFTLNGLSYIATLFGGWLADSFLGKYRTVFFAFVIYIAGCAVWSALYPFPDLTFKSCNAEHVFDNRSLWCTANISSYGSNTTLPLHEERCAWAVFLAITVISIGYGCVRVNIIPFGAHQVEHEGQVATRAYFNWLYWFFNVGSLIAFGVFGYIQQDVSYFYGYLAPSLILVCAVVIFLSGSRFYVKKFDAHGSILSNIFCICKNAVKISCHESRNRDIEILTSEIRHSEAVPCCLDYARVKYGGQYTDNAVNDVKALGKVVLVFASIIPYWTVYYQMQTTFMVQGLHMRLDFRPSKNITSNSSINDDETFMIPASWLMMFDVVFVLLLLPLLDRVIYPRMDRAGCSPSLRLRILIGMLFTVIAMVIAGAVENYRLHTIWPDDGSHRIIVQIIGCTKYYAADMSVLWQIPQYAFVGISEIFTSTAGLELAFIAAPRSMKGIIMGLYWFCEGLGSLLGSATIAIFENVWFPDFDHGNINCDVSPFKGKSTNCHLDFYFYTLAGFQVLGILIFIVVAWTLNIGQSIPLRVQEQGVTVVRSSENTPRPIVHVHDVSDTGSFRNHIQRRNIPSGADSPMDSS